MEPLRIAVCDDEQAQRELWEKYIRKWAKGREYQAGISSFSDGEALLAAFSRESFDLLLLDIQMQGTDGMCVARKIRAAGHETGILFVTGYEDYLAEGYEVVCVDNFFIGTRENIRHLEGDPWLKTRIDDEEHAWLWKPDANDHIYQG